MRFIVPTVEVIGPYRFFFFSNEGTEPVHIHVEREDNTGKFWLNPVSLAYSSGFSARELRAIEKIVIEHQSAWVEVWNEYFNRRTNPSR
jgi:hypothetical protein